MSPSTNSRFCFRGAWSNAVGWRAARRAIAAIALKLAAVLAAVPLALLGAGLSAQEGRPPNVLILLADDLGYSDIGCYGGEIATPRLDALAAGGLRFSQFYNTARCWPTRAALLTGYYAQQVRRDALEPAEAVGREPDGGRAPRVRGGAQAARPAWAKLLPEMLQERGYRAYHSGKWHVDGQPLRNGFDHSLDLGGNSQSNYFTTASVTEDGKPIAPRDDFYATSAIADHAVRCLREHAEHHADRPFFHYVCFTAPHFPLQAPAEDIARHRGKYDAGWSVVQTNRAARLRALKLFDHALPAMERDVGPPYHFADALKKLGEAEVNRPVPWEELTPAQRAFQAAKMEIHAAMIDRMDREIGRVLEQVKAMGAWDDTLTLFLSDNGASAEMMVRGAGHDPAAPPGSAATFLCLGPGFSSCANTPFRRHKTWVHEGGVATPLIAHWPRGIAARGEIRRVPGHAIDVAPTVLEVAGAADWKRPADAPAPPGVSLVPAFGRDAPPVRDELWWLHEGHKALRVGDWKLVSAAKQPWELYDLSTDRGETKDLAGAHPERVAAMSARWRALHEQFRRDATRDLAP